MLTEVLEKPVKKTKVNHFLGLRKEIDKYFKENNISEKGGTKFFWSSVFIFSVYVAAYFSVLFLPVGAMFKWGLCLVMGVFHALSAMNIVHDAVHNSAFKNNKWNKWFGYAFNILGASTNNWRIQHNILHHKYTNVDGKDRDIDTGVFLRLSPKQERKPWHKVQHFYTWALFGILHLNWITFKDFLQFKDFVAEGYIKDKEKGKEFRILLFSKMIYWVYALIIPTIVLTDLSFWQILVGFVSYQAVIGIYLSTVFQLAHVIEDIHYPDADGVKQDWMMHQLTTTCDFNPTNRVVAWFTGGLNNQVIHHLFPHISRVHYTKLNRVMRSYLEKHNLPYNYKKTTMSAILSHYKQVRSLALND